MIHDGARHFEPFEDLVYLNAAAQSPLPRVTVEAMREAINVKVRPQNMPDMFLFDLPNRARAAVAPLIGAEPSEIFLGNGMSHGSNVAALGFPWQPGDEVVLTTNEFPANLYIWANAAKRAGGKPVFVKGKGRAATTDEILAAFTDRTRAVMVSLVDFGSGEVQDVARLVAACRERGAFLGIDGTQAAGIVPVDVKTLGANLFTAGAYKWMLGPYGAGFGWLDAEWFERIAPTYVTWTAAEGAENFNALPRETWKWVCYARRFDAPETASFVNMTAMARSAEFITELGRDAIYAHVTGLLSRLEANLPNGFRRRATPSKLAGPILLIEGDDVPRVHAAYHRLREHKFWVSLREDGIRVSPHIYNTEAQIDAFLETLASS